GRLARQDTSAPAARGDGRRIMSGGIRERMRLLRGQGTSEPETTAAVNNEGSISGTASGADTTDNSAAAGTLSPEWDALQVTQRENDYGEYLLRRVRYPLEHRHGYHRLSELAEAA